MNNEKKQEQQEVIESAAERYGIKKLSDYTHLRLRTEMFLGSRTMQTQNVLLHTKTGPVIANTGWVPALMTSFREIIDNSLDEFTKANINGTLSVAYHEQELMFEISDNGRGIPIDWDNVHNCHIATMVMSHLKAGRNFNDDERKGVAGMNGLGGSAVTNVSSEFEIEIIRAGSPMKNPTASDLKYDGNWLFTQRFFEGNDILGDELQVCDPVVKRTTSSKVGTTIRFRLSPLVFKDRTLPGYLIESLLREIQVQNPQHRITFNGAKLPIGTVEKILFNGFNTARLDIKKPGFVSTFYLVPDMTTPDVGLIMHSLVNNIPTYEAGNHLETFKRIFALGLIKSLEKDAKRKKLKLLRSDVEEGLLIYNTTVMDGPYFNNQAKTKLINDDVIKPIEAAMNDAYFEDLIKRNKKWIDEIFARCADRSSKKDADELARAAKKNLRQKVAKLRDANEKQNRSECTIFIAEGDCLHEDESVYVLGDCGFETKPAKDLEIGDIVLTAEHNLKPIIAVSKKVKNVMLMKTSVGEIKLTGAHRLLVQDKNGTYLYKRVINIQPHVDRLVRSQIPEHDILDVIQDVQRTTDEKYKYCITTESGNTQLVSEEHGYCVFDFQEMNFRMIRCSELQAGVHGIPCKVSQDNGMSFGDEGNK